MIRLGLAGLWHVHTAGYVREALKNEEVVITSIWDNDTERAREFNKKFGGEIETDFDKFINREDVDAVIVCSSTDLHKDIIIKAARAGKHVFTEKVLTFTSADAYEVRDEIRKSGVKFCISFPWKTRGDFQFVKQAVDSGLIGKINYCRMRNAHNGASSGWLPQSFYDKETCGGGAMMDLGAHSMYILNWLLGKPEKAASAFTNVKVSSVEDNAVTVMTYAGGAIGVSETGFVAENNPFEFELSGSKGTLLAGGFNDKLCYNTGDGWVFPKLPEAKPSPLNVFLDALENGGDIPYTVDDAVALSETMELAYKNIM